MHKNYPPFHLSVNKDGIVSLWDRERDAQVVRGEMYVCLELTEEQVRALDLAQNQAARLS